MSLQGYSLACRDLFPIENRRKPRQIGCSTRRKEIPVPGSAGINLSQSKSFRFLARYFPGVVTAFLLLGTTKLCRASERPIALRARPWAARSPEELRESLRRVPEIDYYPVIERLRDSAIRKKQEREKGGQVSTDPITSSQSPPEFTSRINGLLLKEARAAGLPVQERTQFRDDPRTAKQKDFISGNLRAMNVLSAGLVWGVTNPQTGKKQMLEIFRHESIRDRYRKVFQEESHRSLQDWCNKNAIQKNPGFSSILVQMLQVEEEPKRMLLIRELGKLKTRQAGMLLAAQRCSISPPRFGRLRQTLSRVGIPRFTGQRC